MKVFCRVKTNVTYIDEDGDELDRHLYVSADVLSIPHAGDRVYLPTPKGYEVQEFKVRIVLFVVDLVLLIGETQNHYMNQEIFDDLVSIGYSEDKPKALQEAESSLLLWMNKATTDSQTS